MVGMVVLQKILSLTAPVARALQDPEGDLLQCMEQVTQLVEVLQEWRSDDAAFFNSWFSEAEKIGDQPIAKPRYVKRAVYAKNYPAETPSQYYRVAVFNPVIDMVISQLQQRFQAHESAANHLAALVPKFISERSFDDLRPAYDIYASFLDGPDAVESEFILWKRKWVHAAEAGISLPCTVTESIAKCQGLPNIRTLLLIFATIPVTTATNERSFSQLRILKTYLRSTMDQDRLSNLALGRVHRSLTAKIAPSAVAKAFVEMKSRRTDFGDVLD